MQLPKQLQKFPQPTLIVTSDSVVAKFFLAGGDSLEELDGVSEPREKRTDSEGYFTSWDESRHGGPDSDLDDTARQKTFARKIAERIRDLVAHHGVAKIHFIMPAEIEHVLTLHLTKPEQEKIGKKIHLDVMKEDAVKIMGRIVKSLATER